MPIGKFAKLLFPTDASMVRRDIFFEQYQALAFIYFTKKVSPLAVQTLDKVILEFNSPILRYLLNRRSKTAGCQIKICIKLESDANDIRSRSYHAEVYVKTKLTSLLASSAKS